MQVERKRRKYRDYVSLMGQCSATLQFQRVIRDFRRLSNASDVD
jgi:hypothetical protein